MTEIRSRYKKNSQKLFEAKILFLVDCKTRIFNELLTQNQIKSFRVDSCRIVDLTNERVLLRF